MAKIFSLLALLVVGCSSQPTQVIVTVDAESGVRAAATQLHLVVGDRFDQALTGQAYPFELALAPLNGDASRVWSVTATASASDGAFVGRARAVGGYVEGQTLFVRLLLEDSCRGVVCGADETCSGGVCVDAGGVVVPSGDAGVGSDAGDAGVDLGRDAGDAGTRDAGPVDGGGTCPAFLPGTWHIVGTQGLVRTDCPPAFARDVAATVLADLQTVCPTCSTTGTPCESVRNWTRDGYPQETRLTLVTASRVTGMSGEAWAPGAFNLSTCHLNIEAVRTGL